MPRQDTATTPPDSAVTDLLEMIGANNVHILARRGQLTDGGTTGVGLTGNTPGGLHPTTVGAGVVLTTLFEGQGCYQNTSAAATSGRQGMPALIPFGADHSGDPVSSRRPLRYTLEALVIRTAPVAANVSFGYGFRRTNATAIGSATPCIAVESISTVNGGNWTVFSTRVNAGAQTTFDTGIPGSTRIFLQFIYDDTTAPRLQILMNGATVWDVSGLANIQSLAGAEQLSNGFFSGAGAVGQVDRVRQVRFLVQLLPGFPV